MDEVSGCAAGVPDEKVEGRSRRRVVWRLLDRPAPVRSERLSRLAGLRVLRVPGIRRVLVLAGSVDRVRELAAGPRALAPTVAARVVVVYWRAPRRGWSGGGVGPMDGVLRQRVALPRLGRGVATVAVRMRRPTPLREVLGGVLGALAPARPLPAPASPDLTGYGPVPGFLDPRHESRATLPDDTQVRPYDVVLATGDPTGTEPRAADPRYGLVLPATRSAVRGPAGEWLVLADARRINPRGRRAAAYRPDAPRVRLEVVERSGRGHRAGRPVDGPGLDAATLATLRQVGVVDCRDVPAAEPVDTAALLVQLAMTGATLHVPDLPSAVADLLAPELRAILDNPVETADPLAAEARSVRQRRAAMRGHDPAFALPPLAVAGFPTLGRLPTVSAILATRRPELLAGALRGLLDQTYPELEFVVCPHGFPLPAEARAMLSDSGRPVQVVAADSDTSFGEVLGMASARAGGSLITKIDDDDSYSDEHVWDLVLARHYSGAALVGKGAEFVYLESLDATVRRSSGVPEAEGDIVAGGTMLLGRGDLEAVGGWRPVPRSVDLGLLRRLRRAGASIYRTHPLGYVYHRREAGHTWDPGQGYFLAGAYARWPGIPADVLAGSATRRPATGQSRAASQASSAA
ncbi:hypothetical protein [Plantactinospora sp. GCM10030261]|uniref:hypothetical protein n=1 Tax=Plantactinospora sp. GCM10030261 TaxID=3273420 RepID=UPI003605F119